MSALVSQGLWPRLLELSRETQQKRAAIAYVTSDEHIRFQYGDTLICDASDSAIASGTTNARVIETAFRNGARLYSLENLHAKILVFDAVTSVGSANASRSSANHLIEANWISDQSDLKQAANQFIDQLITQAISVDEAFVDHILGIEVRNTGSNRYRRNRSHPILLYFQEVLPGDIEKYRTTSAQSGTGGGARDLRISPRDLYQPVLERMFPNREEDGTTSGTIVWESDGIDRQAVVHLHQPTGARPNEIRIGRFYDIGSWEIDPNQYAAEREEDLIWFYVLEMGRNGIAYARLLQRQHLELEDPLVAEHVERQWSETHFDRATRGAVDLQTRNCIPNLGNNNEA